MFESYNLKRAPSKDVCFFRNLWAGYLGALTRAVGVDNEGVVLVLQLLQEGCGVLEVGSQLVEEDVAEEGVGAQSWLLWPPQHFSANELALHSKQGHCTRGSTGGPGWHPSGHTVSP